MESNEAELLKEDSGDNDRHKRRRRRRRKREQGKSRVLGGRTRLFYFSMASLWGCLVGTGAVVIVLRLRDAMPSLDGQVMLSLAAALVFCLAGAGIVSAAYYSATRRGR